MTVKGLPFGSRRADRGEPCLGEASTALAISAVYGLIILPGGDRRTFKIGPKIAACENIGETAERGV